MSKAQKTRMLKDIFKQDDEMSELEKMKDFDEMISESDRTEFEYEEYEEEIEIKAKDLAKYVKNSDELLRTKRMKQEEDDE